MGSRSRFADTILLLGLFAGCSDANSPDTDPTLVGTYTATEFTTRTFGGTIDRLAEGLKMQVTLNANGTTVGFVTASGQTVPVAGTWDTAGAVLHFEQETANFMRQVPFQIRPGKLLGDTLLGVTVFHIVLRRR
jgi:hypothetical protein